MSQLSVTVGALMLYVMKGLLKEAVAMEIVSVLQKLSTLTVKLAVEAENMQVAWIVTL